MIEFNCSKCGEALSVPSSLIGRKQVCPVCGEYALVPGGKAGPADAAPKTPRRQIIFISCSRCSVAIGVARHHAGKKVICPKCGKKLRVPGVWRTSGGDRKLDAAMAYATGATVDVDKSKVLGAEPAPPDDEAQVRPVEPSAAEAPQEPPEPAQPACEPVADKQQQLDAAKAYAVLAAGAIVASNVQGGRKSEDVESISMACPKCSSAIGVAMRFAGTKIHCPACDKRIRVPKAKVVAAGGMLAPDVEVESSGVGARAAAPAGDERTDAVKLVPKNPNADRAEPQRRRTRPVADNPAQLIAAMAYSANAAVARDRGVATESDAPGLHAAPARPAEPTGDDEHAGTVTLVPKKHPDEQPPPQDDAPGVFESTWRRQVSEARALRREYRPTPAPTRTRPGLWTPTIRTCAGRPAATTPSPRAKTARTATERSGRQANGLNSAFRATGRRPAAMRAAVR